MDDTDLMSYSEGLRQNQGIWIKDFLEVPKCTKFAPFFKKNHGTR